MNKLYTLIFIAFLSVNFLFAQNKISREDYLLKYKDIAIKEMQRTGIPASITLAQAMLESDNGNSILTQKARNHFGIKCHSDWAGETFYQDDDKKDECFRKYKNDEASFIDHSDFLKTGQRYAFLFDLSPTDYKGWANGLKTAGYATNPKYPEMLIKIIEDNELTKLDILIADQKGQKLADIDNVYFSVGTREIFMKNRIKCIKVKNGDTFLKIAKELDMMVWQLYKYNDLPKEASLTEGQFLYIQPKRGKADSQETHVVKEGETMYTISQLYGVKLKKLYSKNNLKPGTTIKTGDEIWLRKRKPLATTGS